jgi:hypothetical protein
MAIGGRVAEGVDLAGVVWVTFLWAPCFGWWTCGWRCVIQLKDFFFGPPVLAGGRVAEDVSCSWTCRLWLLCDFKLTFAVGDEELLCSVSVGWQGYCCCLECESCLRAADVVVLFAA